MEKVRWGIIGCGDVTEKKSGPAFNKVPDSELIAVMRRDGKKAKDYADRHCVPSWYTDAGELINDDRINAVYIATPPAFHEEYTILALKAGKPVYVEKPMALNLASAENMAAISLQTGTRLSIAHYRRQQPLFKKVKSLIAGATIGKARLIDLRLFQSPALNLVAKSDVNWRVDPMLSGGGLFHDLAPHQLDLMLYFFGKPLDASGMSLNQGGLYQADDLVSGQILFERDIVFNGLWSFSVSVDHERDSCEIVGSEGSIRFSIFKNHEISLVRDGKTEVFRFEPLEHVQQPMIESVVNHFLDREVNPCSGEEGVETMRLMEAFTRKK